MDDSFTEEIVEESNEIKLQRVPNVFFSALSSNECIVSVLKELPDGFSSGFTDSLKTSIDIAENSISVVSDELTKRVYATQNQIFSATNHFITLQELVLNSTDAINAMKKEIKEVRTNTLDPMLDIYNVIGESKKSYKNLVTLHFIRVMLLAEQAISSKNLVESALAYSIISQFLQDPSQEYNSSILRNLQIFNIPEFPSLSHIDSLPRIGELLDLKCLRAVFDHISSFPDSFIDLLNQEISDIALHFSSSRYSELLLSYCIISENPPVSKVILDFYTNKLHSDSIGYFESLCNDLETLFKFMETNLELLAHFRNFISYHEAHQTLTSVLMLFSPELQHNSLVNCDTIRNRLSSIQNSYSSAFDRFCHAAESSVIQFLSRINLTSLDALSFIKLSRSLKEFSSLLCSNGISEWIGIAFNDYLSKNSSVSISSSRALVSNDSWTPNPIDIDFIHHVQNFPRNSQNFCFISEDQVDPQKLFVPSSSMTIVRILHALICLAIESKSSTCIHTIINVISIYFLSIVSNFSFPFLLIATNDDNIPFISSKILRKLDFPFYLALNSLLKYIGTVSLPEQKPIESSESQLMQMITATEGLNLIKWYLKGIKGIIVAISKPEHCEIIYTLFFDSLFPLVRVNLCSICSKNFLSLRTIKYQLISSDWNIEELRIEYHPFLSSIKKTFESLDKVLLSFQIQKHTMIEIWKGSWKRVSKVLISAFGAIRSCNGNGRSLMLGDTRAIASFFTSVSKIETDTSLIMEFINAFFFKPPELLKWAELSTKKIKPNYISNLIKTGLASKLSPKDIKEILTRFDSMIYKK